MIVEITLPQAAAATTLIVALTGVCAAVFARVWSRSREEASWLTERRARELHPLRHEVYCRGESDERFASRSALGHEVAMLRAEVTALREVMDTRFSAIDAKLDWIIGRNRGARAGDDA